MNSEAKSPPSAGDSQRFRSLLLKLVPFCFAEHISCSYSDVSESSTVKAFQVQERFFDLLSTKRGAQSRLTPNVIKLDYEFKNDINWWLLFMPGWNGTASFVDPKWVKPDILHFYTNASSKLGFGAFFDGRWFRGDWPPWIIEVEPSIEYLEIAAILLALKVWRRFLSKTRILYCDNVGAVQA